jgi:hypothetical protein
LLEAVIRGMGEALIISMGRGGGIFYVPNVFPMHFNQVLDGFTSSFQCVLNINVFTKMFLILAQFIP